LITAQTSTHGRQLNFLVCEAETSGFWNVWLQTGSDTPSGQTCTDYVSLEYSFLLLRYIVIFLNRLRSIFHACVNAPFHRS
jgi:hypothetical protein